ncbi:hypothetical protein [Chromobacterium rhizoryzae]|uniref:hypothetical protein n=1 Tax=Chromobacterium rhizoryzae TaxID=1778675 RepID=UPI001D073864|nr:hypothetical protein [Chromobacterium rhizoryzae]
MNRSAALPIVLICLGSVWFLKSTSLLPNTATLLSLLLAAAGVLLFVVDGFNKSTLVTSPLLIYAGGAIYLYDAVGLRPSHLLSFGMILTGLLMLLARSEHVPERSRRFRLPSRDGEQ